MSEPATECSVVTGAYGYTGKYITQRLLSAGKKVRTLTGHPARANPFGTHLEVAPLNFDNPSELLRSLRGATTLYNTYWVRFEYGRVTFDRAIANTRKLIRAAEEAGVRRIVHISITNASEDSARPYFKGKGVMEKVITQSELSYAIIRPTVIFGVEDILLNNIAWFLRRVPVFAIPGAGDYRLQPVFVADVAELATTAADRGDNIIIDAVGPEVYTFDELVRLIAKKVQSRAKIIHLKPELALFLARLLGYVLRDVVLTRDEIRGLTANLLVSAGSPTGKTRLSDWLEQNVHIVGTRYASELSRHYR